MNWYVAKLVFRITTAQTQTVGQFDEHIRLIRADSFEGAFRKARLIGIQEEDSCPDRPRWEFVNISELFPLEELKDGVEVYSRIQDIPQAQSYINLIHLKAAELELAI